MANLTGPLEGLKIRGGRGARSVVTDIIFTPPPVELGLTDLQKSGGAVTPGSDRPELVLCTEV